MVFIIFVVEAIRETNNVYKGNFDRLQINQNWEDEEEGLIMLTEHKGPKTIK